MYIFIVAGRCVLPLNSSVMEWWPHSIKIKRLEKMSTRMKIIAYMCLFYKRVRKYFWIIFIDGLFIYTFYCEIHWFIHWNHFVRRRVCVCERESLVWIVCNSCKFRVSQQKKATCFISMASVWSLTPLLWFRIRCRLFYITLINFRTFTRAKQNEIGNKNSKQPQRQWWQCKNPTNLKWYVKYYFLQQQLLLLT